MVEVGLARSLFGRETKLAPSVPPRTGILPIQTLKQMVRDKEIFSPAELDPDQLQPASIDLRLGHVAYRVRASFLPGPGATVLDKITQLDGYPIDLTNGAVLERGCVYVIPLLEQVHINSHVVGVANPKSSTGRLDILTRLITDRSTAFDKVERGYSGNLYVEVAPKTFSVVAKTGTRLNQLRFRRGSPIMSASELKRLHDAGELVSGGTAEQYLDSRNLVAVTVDLRGKERGNLIGYRAKKHTDRIDLEKVGYYDIEDFWEPIYYHREPPLILDPDDFYILVTQEGVKIPRDLAAEMVAYDTSVGEFRVHYAGFFDPGFGLGDVESKAVLEVRSHDVPFLLDHGQTVGWLQYERMADVPDRLYGERIGSNYQNQGLKLAKQFKPPA
ncbi:2'-deoxycytidine 5'-triphosphate deaminase [Inquilinus limosus]|uniref:2'-deoxycytidine 5'-triphosphate deaminase n=1 Tax=Inquilinus limosus TaxID=171674 RepID=UPI0009DC3D9C|nr:2'-deoxycytidine 5'-triphosphate deaminase [Inquilinus limosus]